MSHPVLWRCRSCGAALGRVRQDGALEPWAPGVTVARDGVARVPCPRCGAVRAWRPEGDPARRTKVS